MLTQEVKGLEAKLARKHKLEEVTVDSIKSFMDKDAPPKWMNSMCASLIDYRESHDLNTGETLPKAAWGLIAGNTQTYAGRIGTFTLGRGAGHKQGLKARIGGKVKTKKTTSPLAKVIAERRKTFFNDTSRGRFKFVKCGDVVYSITKSGIPCSNI